MTAEIGREYGLKDIDGKTYYTYIYEIPNCRWRTYSNKIKFCFIGFVFEKCVGHETYIILLCSPF